MLIKIIEVNKEYVKTARGGYTKAQVVYESEQGRKTQNILDFANKQVYAVVDKANPGDSFEVVTRQNDKGYSEWASIVAATASVGSTAAPSSSKAPTSNYETREERALRQRLIVRQSSLGHAVEVLTTGAKTPPAVADIFGLAEQFATWVYQEPGLFDQPDDLDKDIPF